MPPNPYHSTQLWQVHTSIHIFPFSQKMRFWFFFQCQIANHKNWFCLQVCWHYLIFKQSNKTTKKGNFPFTSGRSFNNLSFLCNEFKMVVNESGIRSKSGGPCTQKVAWWCQRTHLRKKYSIAILRDRAAHYHYLRTTAPRSSNQVDWWLIEHPRVMAIWSHFFFI